MTRLLNKIHERIGDLWWYTALLFCAQRFGDVINMFVGLWLVPKFVPMDELGAVLPLSQFVSVIGLPLGIIAVPFMKYLNVYAERNELGKVKSLLRDGFIGTGVLALFSFLIAYFLLPHIFERMRVAAGSLGVLIVIISILSSISVIFGNAVQGLKLYSTTVWFNAITAPLRLLLIVIFMPFRPLSGYFMGQSAGPVVSIVGALWALRKKLGRAVKAVPYWKEDGRAMIRYSIPLIIGSIATTITMTLDQTIIRHWLSDFDSAGYYMISRFAEIGSYFGSAFIVFLFPMVAAKKRDDASARNVLRNSILGTFASGCAMTLILWLFGEQLLGLQAHWKIYSSLSPHMALLAFVNCTTLVGSCFCTYEMAQGRFRFLWYAVPLGVGKSVGLYALLGYNYFNGILPASWLRAIADFNPNRLGVVLVGFLSVNLISLVFMYIDAHCSNRETAK